ncbi:MAG: putative porin [Candidatus Omnitrophota bacterium]
MKKFVILALFVCLATMGPTVMNIYAGEVDILLEKLVDKGVLTYGEAQEIKTETKEQVRKEIAAGESDAVPKWVQNIKFKGDLRLRYQSNHNKTVANQTSERHRGRIRARLGAEAKVNDKLKVGLGLATGLDDQNQSDPDDKDTIRSTNQSFDSSFAKKPFNLDYAFAQYTPYSWLMLTGGKMKLDAAVWEPGDLMWDTDITPEGIAIDLVKKLEGKNNLFLKTGFYVLEESSSSGDDPWLVHIQPGVNYGLADGISAKAALTLDYFAVGSTGNLNGSSGTNSWSSGDLAAPKKDVVNIMPALEVKFSEPFRGLGISLLDIPVLKLFAEYVKNMNDSKPDDNKTGFMLGCKFGADKVKRWGDWQAKYNYAMLGKDAVLDILPDSDRYSGGTAIRAHEFAISYGLGENTELGFDVYRSKRIGMAEAPETIVQVDWLLKF